MPLFDAVFFDIGSTLIPSAEIIARATEHACTLLERYGLIPNRKTFLAGYQQADATMNPPHISHVYGDTRLVAHAEVLAELAPDLRRRTFFLHAFRESMRAQIQPSFFL